MQTVWKLVKDTEKGFVSIFHKQDEVVAMSLEEWAYLIAHPVVIPVEQPVEKPDEPETA